MYKKRVLIIDDSPTNLAIICDILNDEQIETITLTNGKNIEDVIENNKDISLILLDIILPDIDGYTICKNLKKDIRFKHIPIILLTGLESNENKIKGFECGAIDYITKPFNQKEVVVRVNTHIELYHNRKLLNSKIYTKEKKINELLEYIDRYIILSQTDLKGTITYVSQAFCEISKYSKYELLNQPHNIVRHPDMPKLAFKDLWETIQKGETWQGQVKNKDKEGNEYWVYSRVTPQKDEDGTTIGYTSVRQDISQQKIAEALHKSVNNLLNNANEGFLSFKDDLLIQDGYSIKSLKILNQTELLNKNLSELLFSNDLEKKEIFELGIKSISSCEDEDTKELLLTLLPKENKIKNTIFSIDYKVLDEKNYMAILSDITEKKQLEKKIAYENKIQKMIVVIATRKDEFLELKDSYLNFLENLDKNIDLNKEVEENLSNITRIIHTFKGLLAQEELVNSPTAIHELENKLLNLKNLENFTNKELLKILKSSSLFTAFDKDLAFISNILGKDFIESNPTINVDLNTFNSIKKQLNDLTQKDLIDKDSINEIINNFVNINQKSLKHYLDIYPKRVKNIAERLNKEIYDIEIIGDSNILVSSSFNAFIQSLVHVFRNMIDHGIENFEIRESLKKEYKGRVTCNFYLQDQDNIILTISDDGKGIDINEIKQKAIENNICSENDLLKMEERDILNLIFHNSFSTNSNSDLLSGRGVGLYVVKNELEKINGKVLVESIKNEGTKFIFTLPIKKDLETQNNSSLVEENLVKTIIDTANEFIEKNINLQVLELKEKDKFEIKEIYSVIKISLINNVFIVLSIDELLFNKFLSFFLPDFDEMEIDDITISSTMDEILNIIMGYACNKLPTKYKFYELSSPLAMDKDILKSLNTTCLTFNYALQTNLGDINISILFSE